ncbi:class I SAM-dependent methyltransferase (plasmid) [Haloferacaceae archaeon DSL9]
MTSRPKSGILRLLLGLGILTGVIYGLWWRRHPSPCPYSQRLWIDLPRPIITRSRLQAMLDPRPSERILEIGPGTGYYTLPIARRLGINGTLHALDIQQEMLDHTRTQARKQGHENIEVVHADAQNLPYPDDSFDGAFLVLVLGEVPNQELALRELNRVLKPGGRLIIGELLPDPHFVTIGTLRYRAERQGFQFAEQRGYRFGYFARFQQSRE